MFAAPLYMGNDPRNITEEEKEILLNTEIIAVDQDPFGASARLYYRDDIYEEWARPLDNGDYAAAIYNKDSEAHELKLDPHHLGFNIRNKAIFRDLYLHEDVGEIRQGGLLDVGTGIYLFIL